MPEVERHYYARLQRWQCIACLLSDTPEASKVPLTT